MAAKLSYLSDVLMENSHGLVVHAQVRPRPQAPPNADKNYGTRDCADDLRCALVTPHVAQNTSNRSSAIDGRTTRHEGYAISQRTRKRIEECYGWAKTAPKEQFVL